MKIATWNINSVRLREELVLKYFQDHQPDVICLQETKTVNDLFPLAAFRELGFHYAYFEGMKSYNGVAILSKIPFDNPQLYNHCGKTDCRHISVQLLKPFPIELHCLYIPAGGDIPDPALNEKFAHKLSFLDELTKDLSPQSSEKKMILTGDFNIAPLEHDVWSHKQLKNVVSHTEIEIERLNAFMNRGSFIDSARHFIPAHQKAYSWWSYRTPDWDAPDRGRRLDHIWVSPHLKENLRAYDSIREARGWEPKPSDHVPVSLTLSF
ncbi:MAG: exodeoxyribonuclease III [Alphaproteobacteria bacterium]|jgi:exodeoxyribonuclease-3|nr:exodeoxyribonuclease III [Alphaproteobacteria bacterium]MBP9876834.1 exodeoxyribonuclease III [Alphaproteobacteria bacterium]